MRFTRLSRQEFALFATLVCGPSWIMVSTSTSETMISPQFVLQKPSWSNSPTSPHGPNMWANQLVFWESQLAVSGAVVAARQANKTFAHRT